MINGALIDTDSCGSIGQSSPRRRALSGTYTPAVTGVYTLEIYNYRDSMPTDCYNYIDDVSLQPASADFFIEEDNISIATGGSASMTLSPGAAHAGENYVVLASFGCHPGFDSNGFHIPLNQDLLFNYELARLNSAMFPNTLGVLNGSGEATAVFNTLGPVNQSYLGTQLYFAYALLTGPGSLPVTYVSFPVTVSFIN